MRVSLSQNISVPNLITGLPFVIGVHEITTHPIAAASAYFSYSFTIAVGLICLPPA